LEVFVIIVAFWLILVGVYGGLSLVNSGRKQRPLQRSLPAASARPRPLPRPAADGRISDAALGGLFSEVDVLRAQVEHLRTEVVALTDAATRFERPRLRRHRTGVYTQLPRILRRQVREARFVRHTASV